MKNLIQALIIITLLSTPVYLVRFEIFAIGTNLLDVFVTITICAIAYWSWRTNKFQLPSIKSPITIGCALLIIGAISATVFAQNPASSWGIIKSWLVLPVLFGYCLHLFLISLNKIQRDNFINKIIWSLIFGALLVAVAAVIYDILGVTTYDNRLHAWYLSPNHLAMLIAPMLSISIILIAQKYRQKPNQELKQKQFAQNYQLWAGSIVVVIFVFVLWRTQSLGGILGVFGGLSVVFAWYNLRKSHSLRKLLFVGIALALTALALILTVPKISETLTNFERSPISSRLMIWNSALDILRDNPIIGIAPGQFGAYYLDYQKFYPPYLEWAVPEPHNLFLAIWLAGGLLGIIGFLIILIYTLHKLRKLFSSAQTQNIQIKDAKTKSSQFAQNHQITIPLALIATLTTIVIHGLVDTPIFKNDLALIFATLITISIIVSKIQAKQK